MKQSLSTLLAGALISILGMTISPGAEPARQSVLTYHADPGRSGNFIVPSLTWDRAASLQLDGNFRARISGRVYAQPLYWRGSGSSSGDLLVATEDNVVHAIDAVSGQERWQRSLGKPVPRSSLSCGNISPLGVTGTPVIDASREAIYLDAAVQGTFGPRHLVFALSLKDGTLLSGWPIDVMEALGNEGQTFVARDQNQRGALAILAGNLYVPFGGHFGDCGQYRGFVVGISLSEPRIIKHGRRVLVEAASGRPGESARMGHRCSSRPETPLGRGHGAMVKQSSVSRRIRIGPTTDGISSLHRIGRHSTRAMQTWVVAIRFP
jgi:hypothetical protein